jgi:uncharacterized membrane protein
LLVLIFVPVFSTCELVAGACGPRGVVLRHATGKTVSGYLHEKVWSQIGTEADAKWMIDKQGFETARGFFTAELRLRSSRPLARP